MERPRPLSPEPPSLDPMWPVSFRVTHVQRETKDTVTLELRPPEQTDGFEFEPGQFNMIYAFGIGEAPISICGDPERPDVLVHTVREVGAVSRAICAAREGDTFGVRGPFGSAWPVDAAMDNDVVIVAGGIGLAPLRPIIYQVLSDRSRYGRVSILYGSRTPSDMLYLDQLHALRGRFDLSLNVTVDTADDDWRGSVGPVTVLIPRSPFDPERTVAFVCGPEIMMRFVIRELEERGLDADRIFLSAERNMKCAIGFCGHCQLGPSFVCKDGPVFSHAQLGPLMTIREL